MPLKHQMETMLLVFLGFGIAVTGVILGFLPDLPAGTALWGIAWAVSIAYPLLLYPMLKERRADYSFRMLHFFPALMLLVWLVLQIGAFYVNPIEVVLHWYTWGWTFPVVVAGFAALAFFSFHVIRQRGSRFLLLLVIFIPFVILGAGGEATGVRTELLAALGGAGRLADALKIRGPVDLVLSKKEKGDNADKNLFASSNEEEESWRMRLRRMERREDRLGSQSSEMAKREPPSPLSPPRDVLIAPRDRMTEYSDEEAPPPPNLASSGPVGMDVLGLVMFASTCAAIHGRARKRLVA